MRFFRKPAFWVGGVLLLFIAGWYFLVPKDKTAPQNERLFRADQEEQTLLAEATLDSDSDGLKDWEEILWKTDPEMADSDQDGTPDGEEIKAGRNPAKAGPGDKLKNTETEISAGPANGNEKNPLTDDFARSIFAAYISGSNLEGDEEDYDEVLNETRLRAEGVFEQKFTLQNLTLAEETSDTLKNYGNEVGRLIFRYQNSFQENPLELLHQGISLKSSFAFSELTRVAEEYQTFAYELLKIPAPKTLQEIHLDLINNIYLLAKTSAATSEAKNDPVFALYAINPLRTGATQIAPLFSKIKTYLSRADIRFANNEYGFILGFF